MAASSIVPASSAVGAKQIGFLVFFLVFAVLTYRNTARSRRFALALLIGTMLVWGTIGMTVWPFASWHLFTYTVPAEETFHEIRVVDSDGDEYKYDARAASPALATPIRRYATLMVTSYTPRERTRLACFLLQKAQRYRQGGAASYNTLDFPNFPPHQIGHHWNSSSTEEMDRLVALRNYRVHVRFVEGSDRIAETEEGLVFSVTAEQCS